uniref:non-specific serine/threonine protein kinase n=1 Tax=Parastrongyloides trichosuri TaxID=131310 RepID=A0A0N4ZMB5_PARTI
MIFILKRDYGQLFGGVMSDKEDSVASSLGVGVGNTIISSTDQYYLEKVLGEGGFGIVFKVRPSKNENVSYAMKLEKKVPERKEPKLKMEVNILETLQKRNINQHFTCIYDKGKTKTFFFIVMEMVGKSLADIKDARAHRVLSPGCGIRVSIQCLESVEALHSVEFLHRDLKPANFCIGICQKKRNVYLLDFGMARKYTNSKGELKTPRKVVNFKGTLKFAPLRLHEGMEYSRKDDAESWFYMVNDLMNPKGLPWRMECDLESIRELKEKWRDEEILLLFFKSLKCKSEFIKIIRLIDNTQFTQPVNFKAIYKLMDDAANSYNFSITDLYDWEKEN